MTALIVITFPNMDDANKAREGLKQLENLGSGDIKDSAVVVKDAEGHVKVHGQTSHGTMTGAVGGGLLGLLIGGMLFPLGGLVLGAAGGALVGKSLGDNVDKKFVEEVKCSMVPNSSALFVLGTGNPEAVVAVLRPFRGTVYHTNLDSDKEEELRRALE